MKKIALWLLGILIVCIPVILPLLKSGFFPTHDGEWAVVRLAEMHRELRDSQIPPRWSDFLNHGYGYPLFLFTYPFPYYAGEVLHLAGFGLVNSIKILFVLSVILSGIFMFFLGRELEGEAAGFIAAAFYVFAPFRIVDIYVRGSIGESLEFALFPLLFWLTLRLITRPSVKRMSLVSITLAILILTHNIMALVFVPLWVVFFFIAVKYYFESLKIYLIKYFLPVSIMGLSLSSYFWLPALVEKKFINLSQFPLADISRNFVNPMEFINSAWNYGLRPSFQLGWVHLVVFAAGVITLLISKGLERKKNFFLGIYLLLSFLLLTFLMLPQSFPIWRLPLLSQIDFPWRLMTPLAFFLALGTIFTSEHKILRYSIYLFIAVSLFLIPNFAKPESFFQKPDEYYRANDATTTSADELMPIWAMNKPKNRFKEKVEIANGQALIKDLRYNSKMIQFGLSAQTPATIKINTIYFPGWQFKMDNISQNISFTNAQGIIFINVPGGTHYISGNFSNTPERKWSEIISVLSVLIILLFLSTPFLSKLRHDIR